MGVIKRYKDILAYQISTGIILTNIICELWDLLTTEERKELWEFYNKLLKDT